MRYPVYLLTFIILFGHQLCQADTRRYQTLPAEQKPEPRTEPRTMSQQIEIPLIEVDPDSGEMKVYLRPQTQETETLITSANYQSNAKDKEIGVHQAIVTLHQQMAAHCPQGWLKLNEWAIPGDLEVTLHYSFTCLDRQN